MSQILSDREVKKLLGGIIKGGDLRLLNPNGIELRLGNRVRFISTGEEKEIPPDAFVKVCPGETIVVASLEGLDFSKSTVQKIFPNSMLMAFITPTTTMMREGITQAATKVDAGFVGQLNWGIRNSSYKDLILQSGEPIFKLTFFLLKGDEVPDLEYGKKPEHKYQNTEGIMLSARRVPADIPKDKVICSSIEKLDPKKQLREAGYPFSHIGTELVHLDGKFEMVSKDVLLLKTDFDKRASELAEKIGKETASVLGKLEENKRGLEEHAENLFSRKFTAIVGTLIGVIPILYAALKLVQGFKVQDSVIIVLAAFSGVTILVIAWIVSRRLK